MTAAAALARGRASFDRRVWSDAFAALTAADREAPLEPGDVERLAIVAYLLGRDDDSIGLWERAHHAHLGVGDAERAVRCAFWLAVGLLERGDVAPGGGWIARARRLLDEGGHDCAEQGYLLLPVARQRVLEGAGGSGYAVAGDAAEIGERFGDVDLVVLARSIQGRALIAQERTVEGMTLLDEVMVAVVADAVSAMTAGLVYCSVIDACHESLDLRRAREWTAALTHWCESQPDLVAYSGQCLVHRAEILQLDGAWPDAVQEAQRASERFLRRPQRAAGQAFYQQAEVHRLRGEVAQAEAAYRKASRSGREPQPGLALLRLRQGQVAAALAAIRRVVDEAQGRVPRARLLPAQVEILLAAGDVQAARAAGDALRAIAEDVDAPLVRAVAAHAQGSVLLEEADASAALVELRRAWRAWEELGVPYEAARVRVMIGRACRLLGDEDAAEMELEAAALAFEQLGALPDLVRAHALSTRTPTRAVGGLTAREVEVLRLVAAGKTNRAIAADLVLSEKTVARHVSNILAKLGLSSRAAATAYAYEHDLL